MATVADLLADMLLFLALGTESLPGFNTTRRFRCFRSGILFASIQSLCIGLPHRALRMDAIG